MEAQLLSLVFSALQNLEKCHQRISDALPSQKPETGETPETHADIRNLLPQQEKCLNLMRRQANKLQLQIARKDWAEIVHSLQIFYGLNHILRPELLQAYRTVCQKIPLQHKVPGPSPRPQSAH